MTFVWPIQPPPVSTRGQKFGALRGSKLHTGLDMGTGGDSVLAAAAGTVRYSADTRDARGQVIYLKHQGIYETRYMHLDKRLVSKGDTVAAGQQIGVAGKTGLPKPWPHLHFEVLENGKYIDPESVLPPRSADLPVAFLLAGILLLLT